MRPHDRWACRLGDVPVEYDHEQQWVRMGEPSGTKIQIWGARHPFGDRYGFVDFAVGVVGDGLEAETLVHSLEHGGGPSGSLASFFGALAEDWRGLGGDTKWEAIEHGMTIEATRGPLGHVVLAFVLRQSYNPDAWSVRAVVKVEAGEEMSQLASAVARLVPGD
jgi:hypothetical protein